MPDRSVGYGRRAHRSGRYGRIVRQRSPVRLLWRPSCSPPKPAKVRAGSILRPHGKRRMKHGTSCADDLTLQARYRIGSLLLGGRGLRAPLFAVFHSLVFIVPGVKGHGQADHRQDQARQLGRHRLLLRHQEESADPDRKAVVPQI
ncbi:hypothetical protein SPHINGOAX6_30060 [Sphingomonas sp. AX6]|nr:hypothetical protein SPHINGOAX6_30060 [Sphingomonas sp. AX6]